MEADICNIIALRMKNRKMSWSEKGGNNLIKYAKKIENEP